MAGMVVVEQGELLWPTNGFFVHYVRAKHVYKFAMIRYFKISHSIVRNVSKKP